MLIVLYEFFLRLCELRFELVELVTFLFDLFFFGVDDVTQISEDLFNVVAVIYIGVTTIWVVYVVNVVNFFVEKCFGVYYLVVQCGCCGVVVYYLR